LTNFVDATHLDGDDGRYTANLHPDWEVWGPNGGYLSAIALRAAGKVAPTGHRPAAYSGQYLSSPVSEAVIVEAEVVKPGRSAALTNIRLTQNARTVVQAQVWTTSREAGPQRLDIEPPKVPAPGGLRPFESYMAAEPHPFWSHMEGRPVQFFADDEVGPQYAATECWYRIKDFQPTADEFLNAGRMLLLIDTLPWPTFHRAHTERPVSFIAPSLDLSVWFHQPIGDADWLLAHSYAPVANTGLIHGGARIWSEDMRLLASGGSQLLVVDAR
jgi:acyl-CoA thioesterase-2